VRIGGTAACIPPVNSCSIPKVFKSSDFKIRSIINTDNRNRNVWESHRYKSQSYDFEKLETRSSYILNLSFRCCFSINCCNVDRKSIISEWKLQFIVIGNWNQCNASIPSNSKKNLDIFHSRSIDILHSGFHNSKTVNAAWRETVNSIVGRARQMNQDQLLLAYVEVPSPDASTYN
jgi:hypothetical protein